METIKQETYHCPVCGADTKTTLEALWAEKVTARCKHCNTLLIEAPFHLSDVIRGFPKG